MNSNYFRLYEECYLVNGEEQACIYDLFNEKVFHLDMELKNILIMAENNKSLNEISKELGIKREELEEKLKRIEANQVGGFYVNPPFIEKVTLHPSWKDNLFFKLPPQLNRAFIELNSECNENCFFCDSKRYSLRFRCMGCRKRKIDSKRVTIEKWKEYLEQLYVLEIRELYITGGNVFLEIDKLKEIIGFSKKLGFRNITVVSGIKDMNAMIQLGDMAHGVRFIMQRYLDEDYMKQIENDPIINYLGCLEKSHYLFVFILDYHNKHLVNDIATRLLRNLGKGSFYFDYLLDFENMTDEQLKEIKFTGDRITLTDFSIRTKFNPCLKSTISITADGVITTCPGLREYPLSENGTLMEAVASDNLKKYTTLNCNKIEPCNKCEYRYLCNDCRYIEIMNGALLNQTKLCIRSRTVQ